MTADELAARRAQKARSRARGHEAGPAPTLEPSGRSVAFWQASCRDCEWVGPERDHRMLADHDADRHRETTGGAR